LPRVNTCDDCDWPADYEVTARWPDGRVARFETCLLHLETNIQFVHDSRPDAGVVILSLVGAGIADTG
jgi:hypothetical protein